MADPATLAVGIGLQLAAHYLTKDSGKSPANTDTPPTLTGLGEHGNFLIGRELLAPMMAFEGDRRIEDEPVEGGGKGSLLGGGQTQPIWYAVLWHHIATNGPANKLNRIIADGSVIWAGPITSKSHPSGTVVDAGAEGEFAVYWGEPDQPVNTHVSDSDRVGVASRWPYGVQIVWVRKRLGTSPVVQNMQYDLTILPYGVGLAGSTGFIKPVTTPAGTPYAVVAASDGLPGVAFIAVGGKHDTEFLAEVPAALAGNAAPDGDYEVLFAEYDAVQDVTTVYLADPLFGSDASGTLDPHKVTKQGGVNLVHALWQMLFANDPFHGLGLDPFKFNQDSFEKAAQIMEAEQTAGVVVSRGGKAYDELMIEMFQDHGMQLPYDTRDGLYRLHLVRKPAPSEIALIPREAVSEPLPTTTTVLYRQGPDSLIYEYRNRRRRFKTKTLKIPGDENKRVINVARHERIPILTTTEKLTAEAIAERRSQETLGNNEPVNIRATRNTPDLHAGRHTLVEAPGLEDVPLVVTSVRPSTKSPATEVNCVVDHLGVEISTFEGEDSEDEEDQVPPPPDLAVAFAEVPSFLSPNVVTIVVLRIRATAAVAFADVLLSIDGTTYTKAARLFGGHAGGELDDPLDADGDLTLDQGPEFTALGPDIANVLDLSANDEAWLSGQQLALFADADGYIVEVAFVKALTAVGGSTWRLDGLLRARWGTFPQDLPAGTRVFVVQADRLKPVNSVLLKPDVHLRVKTQPSDGQSIDLDAVLPVDKILHGRGVAPDEVFNLRPTAPFPGSRVYQTGQNFVFAWSFISNKVAGTGAGMQPAGAPTPSGAPGDEFILRVYSARDNLTLQVEDLSEASHALSNAALVAAFGGAEPTSFKVDVAQIRAGYEYVGPRITMTRI